MSKETLKNKIDSDINTNGLQQITGEKLNDILNDVVDEMALGGGVIEEGNVNAVSGGEVYDADYFIKKSNKYLISGGKVNWVRTTGGWNLSVIGTPVLYLPNGGYAFIQNFEGFVSGNSSFVYLTSDAEGANGFNPLQPKNVSTTQGFVQVVSRLEITEELNDINIPMLAFTSFDADIELYTVDGFNSFDKEFKAENNRIDFHIASKDNFTVTEFGTDVIIDVNEDAILFDPFGGYRIIKSDIYNIPVQHVAYLSSTKDTYTQPYLQTRGTGQELFIVSQMYNAKNYNKGLSFPIGMNWQNKWNTLFNSINTAPKFSENTEKELQGLLPYFSTAESPIIDKIAPFIKKHNERDEDVTFLSTGDSIFTNLNYTSARADANQRPPLMTEFNLNSFIEEKLRWKEQKYRRFDYPNIFTEILGGGTSTAISEEDATWGYTGAGMNFYRPLTKCIDGGNSSGVSYSFPAGMRRCNLIIHTDFKWSTQTQISVSEGNGKVEVLDETDGIWKEANGFVFTAKEPDTLFTNGSETYHRDQYQKRINMRSLTDLSEKTITVQNIGSGRFGYWGIEYSPKQYMFTYIAASKGGHDIARIEVFQPWMVDAFNPDLILQQCCIINEEAQTGVNPAYPAVKTPVQFADKFKEYYERLHDEQGYLVFPIILFVGLQAGLVNQSTGDLGVGTFNGSSVTIPDYIGNLVEMYREKNAPVYSMFNTFLDIAYKKADLENTNNIYTSAILGSGKTGNTFTIDSVHLNDYGNQIAFRLLNNYFNF